MTGEAADVVTLLERDGEWRQVCRVGQLTVKVGSLCFKGSGLFIYLLFIHLFIVLTYFTAV